ncbi:hypothetical protein N7471_010316 [Penicillium samsonianum]|uniref:uncharacterized protein n=1 Tax=Penicillium samsonianum TaxID=1882272 RepID=UPI002546AFE7|nr:uncharacterized protein N7471_010316 [Penicillium samsonianum]KAJ6125823.1 hypothetical protein N7471_010316 [Penicillium samsonianum]
MFQQVAADQKIRRPILPPPKLFKLLYTLISLWAIQLTKKMHAQYEREHAKPNPPHEDESRSLSPQLFHEH